MSKIIQQKYRKLTKNTTQRPYGSWDPFTQARYIYDIKKALGHSTTFAREYEAVLNLFAQEADKEAKSNHAAKEDQRPS